MDARLFDLSTRTQIEVTGRDRVKFLHSFCTNDIKKLQPGQGCEAFVTNVNGKVLGHIFVFSERESLWIESVAGSAATLLPHLDRYLITEDVQFTDRSAEFAELLLVGPSATELLERLGLPVSVVPRYGHLSHGSDTLPLRSLRRVDWFESPTWLLSMPVAQRDEVQRTLMETCAQVSGAASEQLAMPVEVATVDEFHSLRIAAGFPLYGIDITEENLAQEVGRTELAISFTKGCYLGQEPIARIDAMGHVNRQLCRLELSSGPLPSPGTLILDKPTSDAKTIGTITSSAGTSESAVALAYLRTGHSRSGTQLFVEGHESRVL